MVSLNLNIPSISRTSFNKAGASPYFSGVEIIHAQGSKELTFKIVPDTFYRGILHNGQTAYSQTANALTSYGAGSGPGFDTKHNYLLNWVNTAQDPANINFMAMLKKIVRVVPMSPLLQDEALDILNSPHERDSEIEEDNESHPEYANGWRTTITFQKV